MVATGFEKAKEIDGLLKQVGIEDSFDDFLQHHLKEVLGRQDPNVKIDSIELLCAGDCGAKATYTSEPNIVRVDSLSIPADLYVVVSSNGRQSGLNISIVIHATYSPTGYSLMSDLRINHQESR